MRRHRSPYASRQQTGRNNTVPLIILALFGIGVVAIGLFVLADQLGTPTSSNGSQQPAAQNGEVVDDASDDAEPTSTPVPPSPEEMETGREVADGWATLWEAEDYRGLYELISDESQARISRDDFVARYEGIAMELGELEIEVEVVEEIVDALRFRLSVTRESSRVGEFEQSIILPMTNENGRPRVEWSPSLIIENLGDGFIAWRPDIPQRGRIVDRNGRPLAHLGQISKVGIIPGDIEDEDAMLEELSDLIGISEEGIQARYSSGDEGWFMPIRDYPDQMDQDLADQISAIPGVSIQKWPERVYPGGPAAAHVVGYLTEVTAEELPDLIDEGFAPGDAIGRAGIEAWGDEYLAGKRGGRMVILNADRTERETFAQVSNQPAADIRLTIDVDLQRAAYETLRGMGEDAGSIVILDPETGAVLAMASYPTYDPNQFIIGHTNESWSELNDPELRPLENRSIAYSYPIGSVFKVVTMAAGMEHLEMDAQTTRDCTAEFQLPGSDQVWRDWSPAGQGTLSLHNALVQSCNTIFYQIGAELDQQNQDLLPEATRGFGFGERTGLRELREVSGTVPDADWKLNTIGDFWARGDAVNLAIGQGFFAATPLQVAVAYAAIANGGTLYEPYLVEEVVSLEGEVLYEAEVVERGELPFPSETLEAIRSAMRDVTAANNGTALEAFSGVDIPTAGKTGTAETGRGVPHSWFAAFVPADGTDLAIATMVEYGGEGSQLAAPMTREIVDAWADAND